MVTLLFILFIIVLIASLKKKKHNTQEDEEARLEFPNFAITAQPMSSWSKVWNMALDKRHLLQYASYQNGIVTLRNEKGKEIKDPLSSLHVDFENCKGQISYRVKGPSGRISFYQTTNISKDEWTVISNMLCIAGSTRGEEIFGKAYKRANYISSAIKVLSKL